jgi:hypothetical protein
MVKHILKSQQRQQSKYGGNIHGRFYLMSHSSSDTATYERNDLGPAFRPRGFEGP